MNEEMQEMRISPICLYIILNSVGLIYYRKAFVKFLPWGDINSHIHSADIY